MVDEKSKETIGMKINQEIEYFFQAKGVAIYLEKETRH